MFKKNLFFFLSLAVGSYSSAGEEPDRVEVIKTPAKEKNNQALKELSELNVPTLLGLEKFKPEKNADITSWLYPTMYLSLNNSDKALTTSEGELTGVSLIATDGTNKIKDIPINAGFNNILQNAQISRYEIEDRPEFEAWKKQLGDRKLYFAAEDKTGDETSARVKTEISPEHYFKALKMLQKAEASREILATKDVDTTKLVSALQKFYTSSIDLSSSYAQYWQMMQNLATAGSAASRIRIGEQAAHSIKAKDGNLSLNNN